MRSILPSSRAIQRRQSAGFLPWFTQRPPQLRLPISGAALVVGLAALGVAIRLCVISPAVVYAVAPAATPSSENQPGCTIDPRPLSDFQAVSDLPSVTVSELLGTPVATPIESKSGTPANPTIVAEVTATMNEFVACINAGDLQRFAALMTDRYFRQFFGGISEENVAALVPPTPLPEGQQAPPGSISDVTLLDDGRVSAITTADGKRNLVFFVKSGHRYLVDGSYELPSVAGTPSP